MLQANITRKNNSTLSTVNHTNYQSARTAGGNS